MKKFKGMGVSNGIAIGKVFLYLPLKHLNIENKKDNLTIKTKKEAVERALNSVKNDILLTLEHLNSKDAKKEAEIFNAHLLFIEDPTIKEKIDMLLNQGFSAAYAVECAFEESAKKIALLKNNYLKERASDLRDVKNQVLRKLLNLSTPSLSNLPNKCIVIAEDLMPSDTARINKKNVLGFVTEKGSTTSHTAILAEALGIPAIVGVSGITKEVSAGKTVIIDGEEGVVIYEPTRKQLEYYTNKKQKQIKEQESLNQIKFTKIYTKSGKEIEVFANIGNPEEADIALKNGADGIGLYRTEFLFIGRESPPTEEEQFNAYKSVLIKFKKKPVIIRTLDIGGDKSIPYLNINNELNPFLGVRAIRLCLNNVELFKTQLRAILRASIFGNARIMYPMIAVEEEIERANVILNEVKLELKNKGVPFKKSIQIGIMVEIPSAALNAERLIQHVDFFSIGTNDLIQYTFAADRTNENVSYLYNPLHPAVLKLIKLAAEASHKYGKRIGMCGEMAGDLKSIPELIRLGLDELSMTPSKIPYVKKFIKDNF